MSKMTMSFDTVTKAFEVMIDGVVVDNAVSLSVYPSYDKEDEFRCCVLTKTEDEVSDMHTMTQICASESKKDVCLDFQKSKFEGFVQAKESVKQTLASLFGVKQ